MRENKTKHGNHEQASAVHMIAIMGQNSSGSENQALHHTTCAVRCKKSSGRARHPRLPVHHQRRQQRHSSLLGVDEESKLRERHEKKAHRESLTMRRSWSEVPRLTPGREAPRASQSPSRTSDPPEDKQTHTTPTQKRHSTTAV